MIDHGISVIPHPKFISSSENQKSSYEFLGKGVNYVGNDIKLTVT